MIYLIDNSNFCYKFKSVYSWACKEVNGVSVDISVLVGYIRSLKSNIFDDIVIVLDGIPVQSLNSMSSYKGQRSKEKDGTGVAVPHLEVVKFLSKIGSKIGKRVRVVCAPQQEADQVISSITHLATGNLPNNWQFIDRLNTKEFKSDRVLRYLDTPELSVEKLNIGNSGVVIASTDADMLQLQRFEGVCVDTSTSGKQVSADKTAKAVLDMPPQAVPLYKAIFGDISDNIPSIKKGLSREKICNLLREYCKSSTDAQELYNRVNGLPSELNEGLQKLANFIVNNNLVREFNKNWDVTFLKFYSVPFVLNFSDYDIDETIKKYGLKI